MTTMRPKLIRSALAATLALPFAAAAQMLPGMYEYTIKISMPGAPANLSGQTLQRCLTAKDLEGNKAYQMPSYPGSDCQVKDLAENGGMFSYKMACTKPQKLDGNVQGAFTTTSMNMDMTMKMEGMPGPMMQSIAARRVGDCTQ
jgi:hypothetical protein